MNVRYGLGYAGVLFLLAACGSTPERSETKPVEDAPRVDLKVALASGKAAYAAKKWREAERHYAILVKRIPQEPDHWFRLGNIYGRTDRPDLAVAAYREVLVRDSDYAKAWFNMGIVQLRQAANSFRKMEVHVDESEPMRKQATHAYESILAIISGDDESAEQTTEIAPASEPPEIVSPAAIATIEPVPAAGQVDETALPDTLEQDAQVPQALTSELAGVAETAVDVETSGLEQTVEVEAPEVVNDPAADAETVAAEVVDAAALAEQEMLNEDSDIAEEIGDTPVTTDQSTAAVIEPTEHSETAEVDDIEIMEDAGAETIAAEVVDADELAEQETQSEDFDVAEESAEGSANAESTAAAAVIEPSELNGTAEVDDTESMEHESAGAETIAAEVVDANELAEQETQSEDSDVAEEMAEVPANEGPTAAAEVTVTDPSALSETAKVEDAESKEDAGAGAEILTAEDVEADDIAEQATLVEDLEIAEEVGEIEDADAAQDAADGAQTAAIDAVQPVELGEQSVPGLDPAPADDIEEALVNIEPAEPGGGAANTGQLAEIIVPDEPVAVDPTELLEPVDEVLTIDVPQVIENVIADGAALPVQETQLADQTAETEQALRDVKSFTADQVEEADNAAHVADEE